MKFYGKLNVKLAKSQLKQGKANENLYKKRP